MVDDHRCAEAAPSGKLLWSDGRWPFDAGAGGPVAPGGGPRRIHADPERVEKGLAQLVLTVIELVRQLMERQALHRVERGTLTPDQEERVGTALMRLAEAMEELKEHFGLSEEDLNIHLGPLGDLL